MIKKIIIFSLFIVQSMTESSEVRLNRAAELRAKQIAQDFPKQSKSSKSLKSVTTVPKAIISPKSNDGGEKRQPTPILQLDAELSKLDQEEKDLRENIERLLVGNFIDLKEQELQEQEKTLDKERAEKLAELKVSSLENEEKQARRNLKQAQTKEITRLRYLKKPVKQSWGQYFKNLYNSVLGKTETNASVDLDKLSEEN